MAATILPLMKGYSVLLAPSTTMGKNVLPRVAAMLDVAQISDIIEVKAPNVFVRPVYAGNALETVKTGDKKIVATVRTTAFASAAACTCATWPKAPNSTLVNDRFIALHMITDRMKPEEPSKAPATTSTLLLSTKPSRAAERPT